MNFTEKAEMLMKNKNMYQREGRIFQMKEDLQDLMNILSLMKTFLGIVVISFFKVMSEKLQGDNLLINICVNLPFWLAIFVFFDWREWVKE